MNRERKGWTEIIDRKGRYVDLFIEKEKVLIGYHNLSVVIKEEGRKEGKFEYLLHYSRFLFYLRAFPVL